MPDPPSPRALRTTRLGGGFSLVELVVVISITGVIAAVIGSFISGPIQGFFDQARRAQLVDAAQLALVRMGRDLRVALPNSVRISGSSIEMLLTLDGDRYRSEAAPGAGDANVLRFDVADAGFNTLRPLNSQGVAAGLLRLAVYPLGPLSDANPYAAPTLIGGGGETEGVMTPAGIVSLNATPIMIGGVNEYAVTLTPGHRFRYESPTRRVFLVGGPVTWRCDTAVRDLLRHDGYSVNAVQSATPAGGTTAVVIDDYVSACRFAYDPGTAQRSAVVTLAVELADAAQPLERIRLVRQVHLGNLP